MAQADSWLTLLVQPAALSAATLAGLSAAAAVADGVGAGERALHFLLIAAVLAMAAVAGLRRGRTAAWRRGWRLLVPVGVAWATCVVVSTAVYLLVGATDDLSVALFESVAGFTTTAMSAMDVEALDDGALLWRAGSQWLGGGLALLFAAIILPTVTGDRADGGRSAAPADALVPVLRVGLQRAAVVYLAFTVAGVGAYLVVGLDLVDAVSYALSTISSGGFAPDAGGLASLDSAAAEWVTAIGMFAAGMNLALLWSLLRGRPGALRDSWEMRAYVIIIAIAATVIAAWNWDDLGSPARAVRHSLFTATSALSTTGYELEPWTTWPAEAQAILLLLIATGGMTAAAAGGFTPYRSALTAQFVRRELARELHPRLVSVVRLARRPVSEEALSRTMGFQFLFFGTAGAVAFMVANAEPALGVVGAMSSALSALATAGPIVGETDLTTIAGELNPAARAWLMVAMVLGRFSIYPVILGGLAAARALGARVRR